MALYKAAFINKDINITMLRFRIDLLMTAISLNEKTYIELAHRIVAAVHEEGN
jgi:hypothetical protein